MSNSWLNVSVRTCKFQMLMQEFLKPEAHASLQVRSE